MATSPTVPQEATNWRLCRPFSRTALLLGGATIALLVPLAAWADAALEARYPFDPACPWGRLANGKGMIRRCLTEDEARKLAQAASPSLASKATSATKSSSTETGDGKSSRKGDGRPSTQDGKPDEAPPDGTPPDPAKPAEKPAPVRIDVGPMIPDEGKVTIGRLHVPMDRYQQCLAENGGLTAAKGEVRVHFLVRAERQRAEGVEVTKSEGVSKAAAQCIADVVDRRKTGAPSQAMLGATLVFKLERESK